METRPSITRNGPDNVKCDTRASQALERTNDRIRPKYQEFNRRKKNVEIFNRSLIKDISWKLLEIRSACEGTPKQKTPRGTFKELSSCFPSKPEKRKKIASFDNSAILLTDRKQKSRTSCRENSKHHRKEEISTKAKAIKASPKRRTQSRRENTKTAKSVAISACFSRGSGAGKVAQSISSADRGAAKERKRVGVGGVGKRAIWLFGGTLGANRKVDNELHLGNSQATFSAPCDTCSLKIGPREKDVLLLLLLLSAALVGRGMINEKRSTFDYRLQDTAGLTHASSKTGQLDSQVPPPSQTCDDCWQTATPVNAFEPTI
ncbi:hypothetical protein ACLOJK_002168 [Asimina triloba]